MSGFLMDYLVDSYQGEGMYGLNKNDVNMYEKIWS